MKKIDFKQIKYVAPAVLFAPVVFLSYQLYSLFSFSPSTAKKGVATDSIDTELPEAKNDEMQDKMAAMEGRFSNDDAFTAVSGLDKMEDAKDSTESGYTDEELRRIQEEQNRRIQEQKEQARLQESMRRSRNSLNGYGGSSRQDELNSYARELASIQRQNRARQKEYERSLGMDDDSGYADESGYGGRGEGHSKKGRNGSGGKSKEAMPEIVKKVPEKNAEKFNTIGAQKKVDEPLIKAMIDQTTKAHEGTRIRFKLLDDVAIKNIKIKKGTYVYGTVTGFGAQRVTATITSILVNNKFIKVNLSVYDNDGMEGFYVPESAFRKMMKDAGAQALQGNIQLNNGYGSELSGESVALQALQNIYQSANSAVSADIRKNRARIKYNTIVYLINTGGGE